MAVIYAVALLGSLGGILAAIMDEMTSMSLLAAIAVGPAIEELCKPIAVIFMLEKRPYWLSSAAQVVGLSVLGAVVFATIENVIYIFVYHPDGGTDFILWRLIICTGLHVIASLVMGIGLAKMYQHIRRRGGGLRLAPVAGYYMAAVGIHAAYNAIVTLLSIAGVLRF
jgi:RsiW-degrading membrane proteinase PrsW (M82 family)